MVMSEWEKMLAGQSYLSTDAEIIARRKHGKTLCDTLNNLQPNDAVEMAELYMQIFGRCGNGLWLITPVYFTYGCNIEIGNDTFVNMNCTFLDSGPIKIGNRCLIGPDVKIYTSSHPVMPERHWRDEQDQLHITNFTLPVRIGNNVWVGGGAILCPGVAIGDNSVIAAGSVVNKSIPTNVLAAGNACCVRRGISLDYIIASPIL